jgi:hypothetical protein
MLLPTAIIFGFDSLSPLCHYSTVQRWGNIIFYGVGSCGVMLREEKKYDEGQALTYQYSKYKIPILVAIESKKITKQYNCFYQNLDYKSKGQH